MLSLQKKFILSLAIGLLVLALFSWLVVFGLIDKIKESSRDYLANQEALVRLDKREALFKELEKDFLANQAELSEVEGAFLDKQEAVGFISTIEAIAQQTGNFFEIKSVNPFTLKDQQGEQESFLTLRVSLWGDFASLLKFLASLEDTPYPPYRLIEIESLSIRRLTERSLSNLDFPLREGDLETVVGIKIFTQ